MHQQVLLRDLIYFILYLYVIWQPCGVHARSDINRITPDVILRFSCANDTSYHWTDIDAFLNEEMKKNKAYLIYTEKVVC